MSVTLSYRPSSNATAGEPWNTAFLSDRDVSARVPINFVPHPGIFVTPACFPDGVYDGYSAQTCLSNLLASEIRRFHLDFYWDVTNRVFSLCPVQIPRDLTVSDSLSATYFTAAYESSSSRVASQHLEPRQTNASIPSISTIRSSSNSSIVTSTTTSIPPIISTTTTPSGSVVVQIGPYQCSANLNVDSIASLFHDYQDKTSSTVDARLQYLVFNLHVAAPYTAPTAAAPDVSGNDLPHSSELLSSHFHAIEKFFYTPSDLESDRQNLNATWYRRAQIDELPLDDYFITDTNANGIISTQNGWPNENYVQLNLGRRIMAGIGSIDSQLAGYPFQDESLLFYPGQLAAEVNATLDSSGSLTNGCFYDPGAFAVGQVNNSWAIDSLTDLNLATLANAADNLTTCGISPVLNYTIQNAAADTSPQPYQDFGNQALFSWAYGEPKNHSSSGNKTPSPEFRCALMVSNSTYESHWRVENCENSYHAACRLGDSPYLWTLSTEPINYFDAADACASGASFGVPRTGLENTYLYHSILNISNQPSSGGVMEGVWINFNSLDVEGCWITTGANGTCPYNEDADALRQRQILVPAIAALIVILLTVLTVLVKCNENRRNSKVRRRGEGGWDYEGVPS